MPLWEEEGGFRRVRVEEDMVAGKRVARINSARDHGTRRCHALVTPKRDRGPWPKLTPCSLPPSSHTVSNTNAQTQGSHIRRRQQLASDRRCVVVCEVQVGLRPWLLKQPDPSRLAPHSEGETPSSETPEESERPGCTKARETRCEVQSQLPAEYQRPA